ncbi:hypothetical protein LLW09_07425 [Pseudomonas paracarnis]|uniref:Uncharacterized protein n=1 Tax=Pseudomonas paracarnis TaxID=2750625 RepID=A0ABU6BQQ5_9PSED|nr:hypothetical protein [Pseudomonas paracarnis]MEB3782384.1 hypothetical protein [Pseudomonas paracarnis]HDS0926251.1 hypothetical protein [Pseudomonas putida]
MTNINFTLLTAKNYKLERRSQRNGMSRLYVTDLNGKRISDGNGLIFRDYKDNKGKSVNPETARANSNLWIATEILLYRVIALEISQEK